ncbi:MAG: hypothetical protein QXL96_08625 [Ignisphaera sp.]
MEVEEYKILAEDSIGFMSEVIVPRMFEALSKPNSAEAYASLIKLGYDMADFNKVMMDIETLSHQCFRRRFHEIHSLPTRATQEQHICLV